MIRFLTRVLLVVQLCIAAVIALLLHQFTAIESAWTAGFLGALIVAVARASITANNFRLARRFPDRQRPAALLSWGGWLRLYLGEFCATIISSCWSMPFRQLGAKPLILSADMGVLLVHGYGCNSGYWRSLSLHLRQAGISHHGVNLEPLLADIDTYIPQVNSAIDELCTASHQARVIVVAHSMGGLVMRTYQSRKGCQRIARLITIGTPHRGTGLAQFGIGANARQMRWADDGTDGNLNSWLSRLHTAEKAYGCEHVTSVYSRHDNIVAPQDTARLAGANNIAFEGIGHVALGTDRRVIACVMDEIEAAQRAQLISIQSNPSC